MNDHSEQKQKERPGYSARLGARMDRSFRRLLAPSTDLPHSSILPMKASMRFGRLRRSRLFAFIKAPLLHARNFLTSPILSRVDGVQATLGTHQRLIAQTLERAQGITLIQQDLQVKFDSIGKSIGFLHMKADDTAIKIRPTLQLNGAYAVPLRDGYIFVPEEEEGLLLMYTGAGPNGLEPGTRHILQMIAPAGGTVVDVGASVGLHTLALARAIGSSGKLYAFEAEPRLEPFLRRTLHANGLHQVDLQVLAVGATHGEATFHVARTIGHSSLYALSSTAEIREEVKVQVRTLDELIPEETKIDVIKIDVEGAELDVIRGAEKILARSPGCAIVAELGPSHLERVHISLSDWLGAFARWQLKGFVIEEPFGELRPADPTWLARQHSVNMLFMRDGSFAYRTLAERKVIKAA